MPRRPDVSRDAAGGASSVSSGAASGASGPRPPVDNSWRTRRAQSGVCREKWEPVRPVPPEAEEYELELRTPTGDVPGVWLKWMAKNGPWNVANVKRLHNKAALSGAQAVTTLLMVKDIEMTVGNIIRRSDTQIDLLMVRGAQHMENLEPSLQRHPYVRPDTLSWSNRKLIGTAEDNHESIWNLKFKTHGCTAGKFVRCGYSRNGQKNKKDADNNQMTHVWMTFSSNLAVEQLARLCDLLLNVCGYYSWFVSGIIRTVSTLLLTESAATPAQNLDGAPGQPAAPSSATHQEPARETPVAPVSIAPPVQPAAPLRGIHPKPTRAPPAESVPYAPASSASLRSDTPMQRAAPHRSGPNSIGQSLTPGSAIGHDANVYRSPYFIVRAGRDGDPARRVGVAVVAGTSPRRVTGTLSQNLGSPNSVVFGDLRAETETPAISDTSRLPMQPVDQVPVEMAPLEILPDHLELISLGAREPEMQEAALSDYSLSQGVMDGHAAYLGDSNTWASELGDGGSCNPDDVEAPAESQPVTRRWNDKKRIVELNMMRQQQVRSSSLRRRRRVNHCPTGVTEEESTWPTTPGVRILEMKKMNRVRLSSLRRR